MQIIKYTNWDKYYKKQNANIPSYIIMDEMGTIGRLSGSTLKVFGRFFYMQFDKYSFWFRFFGGYGLSGRKLRKTWESFGERNGITTPVKLFGWSFKILKPEKLFKQK